MATKVAAKTAARRTRRLTRFTMTATSPSCEKAAAIVTTAHAACDALLAAYEVIRGQRGRPRGMTTDNEQDLLRSMLVMAAGGIDATVKQLIQDSVNTLIGCDEKAKNSFEKFVIRKLQSEAAIGTPKLLAAALSSPTPYQRVIKEYVDQLTGGSLQSVDSLFEVAAALGAEPQEIGLLPIELKPIFDTRNKIIHELDINLSAVRRTRTVRRQDYMIRSTERLFRFAHALIVSVNTRLAAAET